MSVTFPRPILFLLLLLCICICVSAGLDTKENVKDGKDNKCDLKLKDGRSQEVALLTKDFWRLDMKLPELEEHLDSYEKTGTFVYKGKPLNSLEPLREELDKEFKELKDSILVLQSPEAASEMKHCELAYDPVMITQKELKVLHGHIASINRERSSLEDYYNMYHLTEGIKSPKDATDMTELELETFRRDKQRRFGLVGSSLDTHPEDDPSKRIPKTDNKDRKVNILDEHPGYKATYAQIDAILEEFPEKEKERPIQYGKVQLLPKHVKEATDFLKKLETEKQEYERTRPQHLVEMHKALRRLNNSPNKNLLTGISDTLKAETEEAKIMEAVALAKEVEGFCDKHGETYAGMFTKSDFSSRQDFENVKNKLANEWSLRLNHVKGMLKDIKTHKHYQKFSQKDRVEKLDKSHECKHLLSHESNLANLKSQMEKEYAQSLRTECQRSLDACRRSLTSLQTDQKQLEALRKSFSDLEKKPCASAEDLDLILCLEKSIQTAARDYTPPQRPDPPSAPKQSNPDRAAQIVALVVIFMVFASIAALLAYYYFYFNPHLQREAKKRQKATTKGVKGMNGKSNPGGVDLESAGTPIDLESAGKPTGEDSEQKADSDPEIDSNDPSG